MIYPSRGAARFGERLFGPDSTGRAARVKNAAAPGAQAPAQGMSLNMLSDYMHILFILTANLLWECASWLMTDL
jgi:hypothetical protein